MSTSVDGPQSDDGSTTDDYEPSRAPIQNFSIDYGTVNQSFSAIKKLWPRMQRPPPEQVKSLFMWTTKSRNGQLQLWGQRFLDLWYGQLDIGDDEDWVFAYPLGKGGFGAVALFEKQNGATGEIEDEVVVKTTQARPDLAVSPDRMELAKEAAYMGQTNDINDDGMMRLRNFKYYHAQNQWRFYFEYCPYGDLERLRVRYKAYGRYLPELFLWHTFYWLAKTVRHYASNIWRSTEKNTWGQKVDGGFLLHFDIKQQNILLGPADPQTSGDMTYYPIPRMADLGLANVLKPPPVHNAAASNRSGTPHWHPPELRYMEIDRNNAFYPFGDPRYVDPNPGNPHRKGYHPVSSRVNVFGIGAVMYNMLTLKEPDHIWRRIRNILRQEWAYGPGQNESILRNFDFNVLDPQEYSPALRDLIKDCLKFHPWDRPSEDELLQRALHGYQTNLQKLRDMGYGPNHGPNQPHNQHGRRRHHDDDDSDSDSDRYGDDVIYTSLTDVITNHPDYALYYVENEIDSAPDNFGFDHPALDAGWWAHNFVSDLMWVPPHWGRLWPETMPLDVPVPSDWPAGYKQDFERTRQIEIMGRLRAADEAARRAPAPAPANPEYADVPIFARFALDPNRHPVPQQGNPGGFVAVNRSADGNANGNGNGGVPVVHMAGMDTPFPAMGPQGIVVGGGGQAQRPVPDDVPMTTASSSWGNTAGFARAGGPIRANRDRGRYQPYFIPRRGLR